MEILGNPILLTKSFKSEMAKIKIKSVITVKFLFEDRDNKYESTKALNKLRSSKKKLLPVAHYNISLNILTLPGKCPHSLDVAADCIPCVQCACTVASFEKYHPKILKVLY